MNRREFIFSTGAAAFVSGCRSLDLFGSPEMRFGVVSDIHVRTPKSAALFKRSLRYFKRRGVDAVMVAGDLSDWGVRPSLEYVKQAWDDVFAGTDVVPLFCTGNHDYEGWCYPDMTMEMHANGYSEADRLVKTDIGKVWEEVFGEKFGRIRCRTVKGFDFVSSEWKGYDDLAAWMAKNGGRFRGDKPFFYFQHPPIRGTTPDSFGWADDGKAKPVLDAFPNCIAFTGHTHMPFIDERSICQGEFTAVSIPSLSYAGFPTGYENGGKDRNSKVKRTMPIQSARFDLRGGQGYVVDVWCNRVVIERWDLEEEECDSPDWIIPLPVARTMKPFAYAVREETEPVPSFPVDAELEIDTRNVQNREDKRVIALNCEFTSARVPSGSRVFDYEIRAVPKDGSTPLVKRFLSPAYAKLAKYEPERQRFWFDVAELPQDRDYVIEVRACNCFGKASKPLVSRVFHGKPGLSKCDPSL